MSVFKSLRVLLLSAICISIGIVFASQLPSVKSSVEDLSPNQANAEEIDEIRQKSLGLISPGPTPDTQQIMLGGFYSLENDLQAKLLLNNKDPNPKEIRPTIYSLAGTALDLPPVTVEGMSFRFVDLSDWALIGGESFRQGSLRLSYTGKDLAVGAQICLTDEARSLSFEEKLQNVGGFDSRQLEGVWFQPSNQTETRIIVSNASNSNLTVTARLSKKPRNAGDAKL